MAKDLNSPTAMLPKLSVVIPSHDNLELLKRCVSSWKSLMDLPTELVIIEDGCTDSTAEWLASIADGERIRWFHEDDVFETLADNRGMSEARGEYILIWQDDMFLRDPAVIRSALELLDENAEVAVVGLMRGMIYRPFKYTPQSYEELYDPVHARIPVYGSPWRAREVHACVRPWIVRRECIEAHGLFDPIYAPFNWDEADLHMRLRVEGWRVATIPGERMNGYFHQASSSTSKHRIDWFNGIVFKNGMVFYERWRDHLAHSAGEMPRWSWRVPKSIAAAAARYFVLVDGPRFTYKLLRRTARRTLQKVGLLRR
jgi:GT2 family glycosyltransferase